jgi:hypothetical protein
MGTRPFDKPVTMKAKYNSACKECQNLIRPGQSIVYLPINGVSLHINCFRISATYNQPPYVYHKREVKKSDVEILNEKLKDSLRTIYAEKN